ncbi:hypothetical protein BGZ98_001516 [Dissophora globulifera]|nr:hypothetical protein BGZ98_001516 [Dissophora globulifera]
MAEEWRFFGCTLQDVHCKLGSPCLATLLNGKVYSGYLYSVDPETHTVLILLRQNQERAESTGPPDVGGPWTMVAIRRHALRSWECSDDAGDDRLGLAEMDVFAHIALKLDDPAAMEARKERLVAMLRAKRIPVETTADDAVVHILGSAHVRPPYVPMTVECANAVVRERVKGMVQQLG